MGYARKYVGGSDKGTAPCVGTPRARPPPSWATWAPTAAATRERQAYAVNDAGTAVGYAREVRRRQHCGQPRRDLAAGCQRDRPERPGRGARACRRHMDADLRQGPQRRRLGGGRRHVRPRRQPAAGELHAPLGGAGRAGRNLDQAPPAELGDAGPTGPPARPPCRSATPRSTWTRPTPSRWTATN